MKNIKRPLGAERGDLQNKMNVTLMMILLAFFIVLNSLSVPKNDRRKAALGSLIGTLGILPGGQSPMQADKKNISKATAPILADAVTAATLIGEFEEYAVRKKLGREISTIVTSNGLQLILPSSLIFEEGTAVIKPASYELIAQVGKVLGRIQGPFVIEGHTDNRKFKSARYPSSLDLSIGRAGAIARFFVKDIEVDPINIAIAGYGPYRPLFPNDTPEHMKRNDRIRFVYKRVT
ncbi:MAG TPA: hypothetical protein ENI77_09445 [Nitrospirae bacterium]|nr:hypothetical protein [Nitrospirota bacterium]